MKKILVIISFVFSTLFIFSCSSDDVAIETLNEVEMTNSTFENDSLIINLRNLNDSLIANSSFYDSRSIKDVLQFLHFVSVVAADIQGAKEGAEWGYKFLGIAGATIGAAIVGAAYSALALAFLPRSIQTPNSELLQERAELAYVNAKMDKKLIDSTVSECDPWEIKIPESFESSLEVGIYHNATLQLLQNDFTLTYSLQDGLTEEQISMLHSSEFRNNFNKVVDNPNILSWSYISENADKQDRIIQLFLEAYSEYPSDLEDVNYLINSYISLIEKDNNITESEKAIVYSALSTAAFSSSYWSNKSNQ